MARSMRQRLTPNSGTILEKLSASAGTVAAGVGSAGDPMAAASAHQSAMTSSVPQMYPTALFMGYRVSAPVASS